MIIFANRDIEKGKEISSRYFYGDYNERTRVALNTVLNATANCVNLIN